MGFHFGLGAMKLGNLWEASFARTFKPPQINDLSAVVAEFLHATTAHQAYTIPYLDAKARAYMFGSPSGAYPERIQVVRPFKVSRPLPSRPVDTGHVAGKQISLFPEAAGF